MANCTTTKTVTIACPACNSDKEIKTIHSRGDHRYECKACAKLFHTTGAAIRLYYSGMGYRQIAEHLAVQNDIAAPPTGTVYESTYR